MAEAGLESQSLSDIAAQIRRKAVSPVEVIRTVLDRLEHLNPRLNALMTHLGEQALEAAKRAEQDLVAGQPQGPLHGVPLALKDIFAMQGVQVTGGSKVLGEWIPNHDATVVARLKAAGAIFVGTLKLDEFATGAVLNSHYGPTYNPWHLDHTTGWVEHRLGGSGGGRHRLWFSGDGYRWLGANSSCSVWSDGVETNLRPCQSLWRHSA